MAVASSPSTIELGPDEPALGTTPATKAINAALRALSRAARAFALYDSKHEIILRFLSDYREKLGSALMASVEVTLEVQPFSLRFNGETVYEEHDRERSLAFRLFRDGVRSLTFRQGLQWDESVRLLELLSVRVSSARQQEDDLVTLLKRAHFQKIAFTVAEGFTPDEEHPEPLSGAKVELVPVHVEPPPNFDQPLPADEPSYAVAYREVPPHVLQALRAEESPTAQPRQAVRLVVELLRAANGPASELSNAELVPLVTEVRDACVADGAFPALLELVRGVQQQHGIGSDLYTPVLAAIAAPEVLEALFEAVPPEATSPPRELTALLLELPGEPLDALLARLERTTSPVQQAALVEALGAFTRRDPSAVLERLPGLTPKVTAVLVPLLMDAAPEQVVSLAARLAESAETSSQLQALELLHRSPRTEAVSKLLLELSERPDDAVFARAATAMAQLVERRGFDALVRQLEARATSGALTRTSATAVGEALVALSPKTAVGLFRQWVQLRAGLLGRLSTHHRGLLEAAVAGLGLIRDPEAEALIRDVQAHTSDEELKKHCVATLARRRHLGGPARG